MIRQLERRFVRPGATIPVTVTVPTGVDRFVLKEQFGDGQLPVGSVSPESVQTVIRSSELYAVFSVPEDGPTRITYTLRIPETIDEGRFEVVDGSVVTARNELEIGGTDTVMVVSDLFEWLLAKGEITTADLEVAAESVETGDISLRQFDLLTRGWLRNLSEDEAESTSQ